MVFPEEGNAYISYEQNTSLTYEDGEVVKEVINFTNVNLNTDERMFTADIQFAKPIPYLGYVDTKGQIGPQTIE